MFCEKHCLLSVHLWHSLLVFNFFDVLLASVISVVFCLIFVIFRAVVLGKIVAIFDKRIIRDIKNRKLSFKMILSH